MDFGGHRLWLSYAAVAGDGSAAGFPTRETHRAIGHTGGRIAVGQVAATLTRDGNAAGFPPRAAQGAIGHVGGKLAVGQAAATVMQSQHQAPMEMPAEQAPAKVVAAASAVGLSAATATDIGVHAAALAGAPPTTNREAWLRGPRRYMHQ